MVVTFDSPHASIDRMPGATPTFRFSVTAEFPSGGWTWTLEPREPQGINPFDLLLILTLTAPDHGIDMVIPELIEFVVENPAIDYTTVHVAIEGDSDGTLVVDPVVHTS